MGDERTVVDVDQIGLKYKRGVRPDVGLLTLPQSITYWFINYLTNYLSLSHSLIYFTMYSK